MDKQRKLQQMLISIAMSKDDRGYTLIEALVVVVIIGISIQGLAQA